MKVPNHMYSNYLISVPFDSSIITGGSLARIAHCEYFLHDLAKLARENGKRLYATYSIVRGKVLYHAHFAVSWIPTHKTKKTGYKGQFSDIKRKPVIDILESNYFIVDNPKEAIKRITHDKRYVTAYVLHQPKPDQLVVYFSFFEAPIVEPSHSEKSPSHNSSERSFAGSVTRSLAGCIHKLFFILMISILSFVSISTLIAMLL